jgi:hypothetical protein
MTYAIFLLKDYFLLYGDVYFAMLICAERETTRHFSSGRNMRSVRPRGISRFIGPGNVSFRGAVLYGPDATDELLFLSNSVIIFEAEVDQTARTLTVKGWE